MRADNTSKPAAPLPQRILIAEDDPSMAHAIKRVLRRAGYETAIAADGYLAGSLLHTFKPSLMTLDLRMPSLNGLEVLDFLQGLREPLRLLACRVLVVSAESEYRIAQALSMGAHGAVSKPFTNDVLLHQVARLLNEGGLKSEVPAASAGRSNDVNGANETLYRAEDMALYRSLSTRQVPRCIKNISWKTGPSSALSDPDMSL